MKRGLFISLEGGEGCGKTTQARLLAETLERHGIAALLTREPGGEPGAEAIRALLVEGAAERWDKVAETLLFLAARAQHAGRVILPALEAGKWVICDRFHDSTRVYQGIGKGLADSYYGMLHRLALGGFAPDLTFVLDIDVKTGLGRSLARRNAETRFERMDTAFHERVRAGFLRLAAEEPERCRVLDASAPPNLLHESLIDNINHRLSLSLSA